MGHRSKISWNLLFICYFIIYFGTLSKLKGLLDTYNQYLTGDHELFYLETSVIPMGAPYVRFFSAVPTPHFL